ncbi:MAG: c-type cytochrome [Caldilineaceae bacterium]|nr:c-type cytochrome [Caldilineaceae bacterium]
MSENRSAFQIVGALLGLVILIVVINAAVGYYREGATEFSEQSRAAGRPITLAETISGTTEAVTATETITGVTAVTATAATTVTAPVTETTALTETAVATETTAVTATEAATATTAITETATMTASEAVTATPAITVTEAVTATGEVTTTAETTETSAAAVAVVSPEEVAAIVTKGTCFACHIIPGVANAVGQVGPDLTDIGVTGATRIEGYTAEQYIRESLLDPNAYIAPECPTGPCVPNLMVQNLGDVLTPAEIDTIVAYLSSLGVTTQ